MKRQLSPDGEKAAILVSRATKNIFTLPFILYKNNEMLILVNVDGSDLQEFVFPDPYRISNIKWISSNQFRLLIEPPYDTEKIIIEDFEIPGGRGTFFFTIDKYNQLRDVSIFEDE